jgi:hypothetical protein
MNFKYFRKLIPNILYSQLIKFRNVIVFIINNFEEVVIILLTIYIFYIENNIVIFKY